MFGLIFDALSRRFVCMKKSENNPSNSLLEYILTHYRGLFAVFFLLPLSVAYNIWFYWRNRFVFWMHSAPEKHAEKVEKIRQQVLAWNRDGRTRKLCTSRSVWLTMSELVPSYKRERRKIKVDLMDVLHVDSINQTVRVQPLVNMGQITATLLPLGWTLPVVPELDDLTVGGLIMGLGIESSSHKYGLFQHICESFEIITADGSLISCSEKHHPELFYAIPWSHGTLGILVSVTLKIIPVSPFIRITYTPLHGIDNIVDTFSAVSRQADSYDFVECLQYGHDKAVLMTGNFADKPNADGRINRISAWYKPWFYKHVHKFLYQQNSVVEYIPTRQYYHRHTRSLFWEMEQIIPFGNHPVFRFFLGWALPPRIALLKYFETETTAQLREQFHVVQDMLMPISKLYDSLQYFDKHYNIYPLWICPMRIIEKEAGFIHPYSSNNHTDELFVDIGAYGTPSIQSFNGNDALHELEQFVIKNSGYQALYARSLLSENDFRVMFDHSLYDKLQKEMPHTIEAFGTVYEKVKGRMSASQHRK